MNPTPDTETQDTAPADATTAAPEATPKSKGKGKAKGLAKNQTMTSGGSIRTDN